MSLVEVNHNSALQIREIYQRQGVGCKIVNCTQVAKKRKLDEQKNDKNKRY